MSPLFPMEQSEKTSDDYLTPRWVFDVLDLEFDLDVAAPPWDTHVPALRKFTKADDGLSQEWVGRVWMNPPYSNCEPWVDRFIAHKNGIALLPYVKAFWRLRLWESEAAWCELRNTDRLLFGRDGKPTEIMFPTFFVAFGDECIEAVKRLGLTRSTIEGAT